MLLRRYPDLRPSYAEAISRLAREVNESFTSRDAGTRVETPMSLRTTLDRIPVGLRIHEAAEDSLRAAWVDFVLPHIDSYDRDHYETVWNAVVRIGPQEKPFK